MNRAAGEKREANNGAIDGDWIDAAAKALEADEGVRKRVGEVVRLSIDRPLPFICVYRVPEGREDKGTAHLVIGEASYLIAPGDKGSAGTVRTIVEKIAKVLSDRFGAFMVLEVWAADKHSEEKFYSTHSQARFRIFTDRKEDELPSTVEELAKGLEELRVRREVAIETGREIHPPEMVPLLDGEALRRMSCLLIGLEISPIYRDAETGEIHLSLLADLRRGISKAFQKAFFEFVHVQTPERPTHPQMLGRRVLVDAVWKADAELAELSDKFNYLMAVTPVNSAEAFQEFKKNGFEKDPVFHYRLLTIDPEDLKRRLYAISFDEIEDSTAHYLLRDKRIELDRQITLLEDRNTPRFLYESLQLFPPVDDELLDLSLEILGLERRTPEPADTLDAEAIKELAEAELDFYRDKYPKLAATAEIRKDTPPGLMVSSGNLMIGVGTTISELRAHALLQHEVGTHIVTYYNGRAQPFKLLYSGLPGYEQLQEGLAVFTEYLVGGLTLGRLKTLAARVIAVKRLTDGRKFTEVFDELVNTFGFGDRIAFNIAMRAFRGGGLTKDAVYLRGLADVLRYIREGGDIETLFIGKMGFEHIPMIKELEWREVLRPSPLTPRYMEMPETAERLKRIKEGASVFDLV
jgi:uncharacterized protein (TIGR02421 family)